MKKRLLKAILFSLFIFGWAVYLFKTNFEMDAWLFLSFSISAYAGMASFLERPVKGCLYEG